MSDHYHAGSKWTCDSFEKQCKSLEAERDRLKAEVEEAHGDCVRLQQEINMLRMEPCQLPHCISEISRLKAQFVGLKDHYIKTNNEASTQRLALAEEVERLKAKKNPIKCDGAYKELKQCSCHIAFPALLARLEAVEHYATKIREESEGWFNPEYEAWRKACGK